MPETTPYEPPAVLATARADYAKQLRRDPCTYCGWQKYQRMTLDHIQPRAAGGENAIATNITGCCSSCNSRKGSLSLLMFLLDRVDLDRVDPVEIPLEVLFPPAVEEGVSSTGRD